MKLKHVLSQPASLAQHHAAWARCQRVSATRALPPRLLLAWTTHDGTGDTSKCPFFGGPRSGIGDANIVSGVLFIGVVILVQRMLTRGPLRLLRDLVTLLSAGLGRLR